MNIISRKEAKAKGLKQYFTGKPCSNGHIRKRATYNGACIRCMLDYRKQNREKQGYARPLGISKHPMYATFNSVRKRARDNGIDFNLEFNEIINNIPEYCPILGIPLFWSNENGQTENSPSFDRVNPQKGYTKDNVQIISWRANRIKNNATLQEMIMLGKWAETLL